MSAMFDAIERESLQRADSRKWSLHPDAIGAWVAEMDFGTAPAVTAALHSAIDDGVLGYLAPATSADMSLATSEWLAREHGWVVDPTRVHPVSDVMAALGVAVLDYSRPRSAVIVPTPAYMPFLTYLPTIRREAVQVPGIVDEGRWRMDLDAIDAAFAAGAGTLVLCNPNNPTGRVFDRAELEAVADIVDRHDGRVFADEIHAPLCYPGSEHIPYASLSAVTAGHTITGTSASKGWNIAGVKAAQLIVSNEADEAAYQRFGFAVVHGASTLGVIASTAAYRHGGEWRDGVVGYLDGNRRALSRLLELHLPEVRMRMPDATYIAWLDCRELSLGVNPADFFRDNAGVATTDGALCGDGFEGFVRFVFAMPAPILEEAVLAMAAAVARHRGTVPADS